MPYEKLLQKHLPAQAVPYCVDLLIQHQFHLKVVKQRSSKFGDYRYSSTALHQHTISVNENLSKYAFLITYIHEVAHLQTFKRYGHRINPHGKEWKKTFQQLMLPLLSDKVFPAAILHPLQNYMMNPKASSCSDMFLFRALQPSDQSSQYSLLLDIPSGEKFKLNGRIFQKGVLRRTRVICKEGNTGKHYLIASQALVEKIV